MNVASCRRILKIVFENVRVVVQLDLSSESSWVWTGLRIRSYVPDGLLYSTILLMLHGLRHSLLVLNVRAETWR